MAPYILISPVFFPFDHKFVVGHVVCVSSWGGVCPCLLRHTRPCVSGALPAALISLTPFVKGCVMQLKILSTSCPALSKQAADKSMLTWTMLSCRATVLYRVFRETTNYAKYPWRTWPFQQSEWWGVISKINVVPKTK